MARLLLIDDEPDIRTYVAKLLELDGHDVTTAASAREALDLGPALAPDLVIADHALNDTLHGLDVIQALKEQLPGLASILISGFPFGQLERAGSLGDVGALVSKPFTIEEMRAAVTKVLREAE